MPTEINQFRLTLDALKNYNISIDWGDGSREIFQHIRNPLDTTLPRNFGVTHTYSSGGVKIISITENVVGGFAKPFFDGFRNTSPDNDATKVKSINQWGTVKFQDLDYSFTNCKNLQIVATDHATSKLDLVTSLDSAWYNCTNLKEFPQIDTSNVTNFNSTWYNCINIKNFPLLNMNKMTNGFNCFFGMKLPTENYTQLLFNLSQNNLNTNVFFNAGEKTNYDLSAQQYRDILTNTRNWDIIDGGATLALNFTKQGSTPTQRDEFNFFTNPVGLNCGVGCSNASASFGPNETVTLDYNATSTPSCLVPNVYYSTSRPVRYTYSQGEGIFMVGNGILNTNEFILLGIDSGLIIEGTTSDGAPYDSGDGIIITYREIVIDMSSTIDVIANIRCA